MTLRNFLCSRFQPRQGPARPIYPPGPSRGHVHALLCVLYVSQKIRAPIKLQARGETTQGGKRRRSVKVRQEQKKTKNTHTGNRTQDRPRDSLRGRLTSWHAHSAAAQRKRINKQWEGHINKTTAVLKKSINRSFKSLKRKQMENIQQAKLGRLWRSTRFSPVFWSLFFSLATYTAASRQDL